MQWIIKHKNIIIGGIIVVIVLAAAFFLDGSHDSDLSENGETSIEQSKELENAVTEKETEETTESGKASEDEKEVISEAVQPETVTTEVAIVTDEGTATWNTTDQRSSVEDKTIEGTTQVSSTTEAVTEKTTESVVTETTETKTFQCSITISCADILNHMDALKPEKAVLVPVNGILLSDTITVTEGETVYEVLRRACTDAGIPLDASAGYVKGIQNLYEFDCGSNSGWKYSVNGMLPNYGSSAYVLKEGDSIQWNYSCN